MAVNHDALDHDRAYCMTCDNRADARKHQVTVPAAGGLAPFCSCGWPETEGGKKMVWRYGDKTAAEHLAEHGL